MHNNTTTATDKNYEGKRKPRKERAVEKLFIPSNEAAETLDYPKRCYNMVSANEKRWLRYAAAKKIYILGGVDPQIIQHYTTDPYARILEGQSPMPPATKLVNCCRGASPGPVNQSSDHQRLCPMSTRRMSTGSINDSGNSSNGGRSFLVNFLNLIHAFLVNRCRNDKSYTVSHTLVRQSVCLYAASSFILMLCCLVTSTEANDSPSPSSMYEFGKGKSDKEVLDHLLTNTRYDKRLLPPVDDADFCCGMGSPEMANNLTLEDRPGQNRGTLTVNMSVLLLSLASPDESSLKYEVEFLLQQQWYDPRLRYPNQSRFDYLNAIHHHEDIWLPDTYFIMHGDFKDPIIPMHFALRIYPNGTINYLMRRHLILSCQGRLNIFPFDDPLCSFALESISYEQSHITYVWKNDEDTLRKSPSLTTLNAYLIQNQTTMCPIKASWRGNYSCLKVDLIFTRDRAFYFTTVFIPGIILVTSSFITFWLEWNAVPARSMIGNYSCLKVDLMFTRDRAFYFTTVFIPGIILVTSSFITFWLEWNAVPARVMIGVTTMLNFFTTSNGFRSTLPVVSNLTAMNVWDGVCMCFIYASLLEFVCVNYVGRKRPLHNVVYRPGENPVTQRLPAVLSRIGIILASPLEIIDTEFMAALNAEKQQNSQPEPQRQQLDPKSQGHKDVERGTGGNWDQGSLMVPQKPVRRKFSRTVPYETPIDGDGDEEEEAEQQEGGPVESGDKKRETGGPNEIVACTSCGGGNSPCTHSANNGCATETCFVQVRKKEPPHPIRVAKTIDVIARITFPTAYAIFLIFFFIHYKGFS